MTLGQIDKAHFCLAHQTELPPWGLSFLTSLLCNRGPRLNGRQAMILANLTRRLRLCDRKVGRRWSATYGAFV